MKRTKLLSAFMVLFTAVGFISCDVQPIDPVLLDYQDPTVAGPAVFKVDFGGQTFTATTTQAVIADGTIAIGGFRGTNGEAVSFAVTGTATGTYTGDNLIMSYDPSTNSEYTYNNFNPATEQTSGTVTISSINTVNHTISGTFSFTGWWGNTTANLPSVPFTNGVFENIPYTETIPTDPGSDGEYFKAKIDGTLTDFSTLATATAGDLLNITGGNVATSGLLTLALDPAIVPGVYDLVDSPFDGPVLMYSAGTQSYTSSSGTLTIISNSGGVIKGTFVATLTNFDETDTMSITEGQFNVEY